jgi:hypothetical protein
MVMDANSKTPKKRKHLNFTLDQRVGIMNSVAKVMFYSAIVYQEHHKHVKSAVKKLSRPEAKAVNNKLDRQKKKMMKAWRDLEESVRATLG